MATYTVSVTGVCSGGEHITLDIKRDGAVVKSGYVVTKTDAMNTTTTFEDALIFFLRAAIKKAGATTMVQAKAAVEAAEWVI